MFPAALMGLVVGSLRLASTRRARSGPPERNWPSAARPRRRPTNHWSTPCSRWPSTRLMSRWCRRLWPTSTSPSPPFPHRPLDPLALVPFVFSPLDLVPLALVPLALAPVELRRQAPEDLPVDPNLRPWEGPLAGRAPVPFTLADANPLPAAGGGSGHDALPEEDLLRPDLIELETMKYTLRVRPHSGK